MTSHDLIDLPAQRPIAYPTWIECVVWRGRQLTISVRGCRWWDGSSESAADGEMSLVFEGLGDGRLATDELDPDNDEALEDLEVLRVSDVPWAQASEWCIYCAGPIREPIALFSKVHDYLIASDAFLTAEHFLNQAGDLTRFIEMTQSTGFMIARGPSCIRDLVCQELERQSAPYDVLRTPIGSEPRLLVRLGNSTFFCDRASAEFPE